MAKTIKHLLPPLNWVLIFNLTFTGIILLSYYIFTLSFNNLIYPGVKIAGVDVGGQTKQAAQVLILAKFNQKLAEPLYLENPPISFELNLAAAKPSLDLDKSLDQAFSIGRTDNPTVNLYQQFVGLVQGYQVQPNLNYQNPTSLDTEINQIAQAVRRNPKDAAVNLDDSITVTPSADGLVLDSYNLNSKINQYLTLDNPPPDILPIKTVTPLFDTADANNAKNALDIVKLNPIRLHYNQIILTIDQPTLYSLLNFGSTNLNYTVSDNLDNPQPIPTSLIDKTKLANFLIDLSTSINQPAEDPRFSLDPVTKRVSDFQAAQTGQELNIDKTSNLITQALTNNGSHDIDLPIDITQPKIAASDVNNLGVKELVGQGLSYFHGSIDNRIYNLTLAANRVNGVLIAPGDEFSFDQAVGDISAKSGFKPGYSIKGGKTVLDDGGGVCQISTTMFRAALNAGLPITARTAHAYRVHYYEEGGFPPGIDATIYSPTVDFKFKNDTANYILVQSYVKDETVFVNLYGTKDGRVVTMTTPKILSQTPPPPEVRQDDPTLPVGTVRQTEFAAWGANVIFSRTVVKDGKTIINESFKSNFQPWAAVYLVGTKTS